MTRVVATLACRAESTRLYGKPLQRVGNAMILDHLIERLRKVTRIDEIALAISDSPSQTAFVDYARRHGLRFVVGPEHDVLGRLIACADACDAAVAVRVTTENPYIYWENLDELIARHLEVKAALSVTDDLPVGAAVEVVTVDAWRVAHREGDDRQRQQGPSSFFAAQAERFVVYRAAAPEPVRAPELRITVDSPEDLIVARTLWESLDGGHRLISIADIVSFLSEHPEVARINAALRTAYVWHSATAAAERQHLRTL